MQTASLKVWGTLIYVGVMWNPGPIKHRLFSPDIHSLFFICKWEFRTYHPTCCSPVPPNVDFINLWPSLCPEAQWEQLGCLKGSFSFPLRAEHTFACACVYLLDPTESRGRQCRGMPHLCTSKRVLCLRRDFSLQLLLQRKLDFWNLRARWRVPEPGRKCSEPGKLGLSWRLLGLMETLDMIMILSASSWSRYIWC